MNEKQTSLAVGVVAVVLAYALYTRFKPAAAAQAHPVAPINIGGAWNPAAPGSTYVSNDQIFADAVAGNDYGAYTSSDDLLYGVSGATPPISSVFLPGRLRW